METDLHAAIRANILEEIHKQYILWQSLKALKYMHSADLLHRDMKPSNLLLNSDCLMKVADFGLARSLHANRSDLAGALTDYVATRWYRAPEILLGAPKYTFAVDMWAVGCILGEMLSGRPIFPGSSTMNQLEKILELVGAPNDDQVGKISTYSQGIYEQVSSAIKENKTTPLQRFKVQFPQASADAIDLMIRLLEFDPNKRITAQQALEHPYIAQFHDPSVERDAPMKVTIEVDDDDKKSTAYYRDELYKLVSRERGQSGGQQQSDRRERRSADPYSSGPPAHRGTPSSGRAQR